MSTKGQMEMMETVIALLVFLVLIVLGLVGYGYYMQGSIKDLKQDEQVERSLLLMNYVLNSAEFQCSNNNIVKVNCVDMRKLVAFENLRLDYRELFGFSRIGVREIHPGVEEVYFYDESRGNDKFVRSVPVLIFEGNYRVGMLVVEVYE